MTEFISQLFTKVFVEQPWLNRADIGKTVWSKGNHPGQGLFPQNGRDRIRLCTLTLTLTLTLSLYIIDPLSVAVARIKKRDDLKKKEKFKRDKFIRY